MAAASRRRSGRTAAGLLAAALVVLLAAGWHYATVVLRAAPAPPPAVSVLDVGERTVTLERRDDSLRAGVWGLHGPNGYAQVWEVTGADDDTVTRRLVMLAGALEAGTRARLDPLAYPPDPATAFFFPAEAVALRGGGRADLVLPEVAAPDHDRLGWRTAGLHDTWVVLVPGQARREAYRLVPTVRELGLPALVVGADAPVASGGAPPAGRVDWRSVQAATDHAFDVGAESVVLAGLSVGGMAVAHYLQRSPDAHRVVGAVLDTPVLDRDAVVTAAAADRGVPGWMTPLVKAIVAARTGVRSGDGEAFAERLAVPVLVFHGMDDPVVPAAGTVAFAAARPDLVTTALVEAAGHLESWNADPRGYVRRLRAFLIRVAG
ncbi:MAG TPA: DUF1749 domain-containing protein [Egibacteraceae bacterium]|nr:DUF1749 domain-containing protein [Egibacteraceae bacterium]